MRELALNFHRDTRRRAEEYDFLHLYSSRFNSGH
jgi:hypothetical protein